MFLVPEATTFQGSDLGLNLPDHLFGTIYYLGLGPSQAFSCLILLITHPVSDLISLSLRTSFIKPNNSGISYFQTYPFYISVVKKSALSDLTNVRSRTDSGAVVAREARKATIKAPSQPFLPTKPAAVSQKFCSNVTKKCTSILKQDKNEKNPETTIPRNHFPSSRPKVVVPVQKASKVFISPLPSSFLPQVYRQMNSVPIKPKSAKTKSLMLQCSAKEKAPSQPTLTNSEESSQPTLKNNEELSQLTLPNMEEVAQTTFANNGGSPQPTSTNSYKSSTPASPTSSRDSKNLPSSRTKMITTSRSLEPKAILSTKEGRCVPEPAAKVTQQQQRARVRRASIAFPPSPRHSGRAVSTLISLFESSVQDDPTLCNCDLKIQSPPSLLCLPQPLSCDRKALRVTTLNSQVLSVYNENLRSPTLNHPNHDVCAKKCSSHIHGTSDKFTGDALSDESKDTSETTDKQESIASNSIQYHNNTDKSSVNTESLNIFDSLPHDPENIKSLSSGKNIHLAHVPEGCHKIFETSDTTINVSLEHQTTNHLSRQLDDSSSPCDNLQQRSSVLTPSNELDANLSFIPGYTVLPAATDVIETEILHHTSAIPYIQAARGILAEAGFFDSPIPPEQDLKSSKVKVQSTAKPSTPSCKTLDTAKVEVMTPFKKVEFPLKTDDMRDSIEPSAQLSGKSMADDDIRLENMDLPTENVEPNFEHMRTASLQVPEKVYEQEAQVVSSRETSATGDSSNFILEPSLNKSLRSGFPSFDNSASSGEVDTQISGKVKNPTDLSAVNLKILDRKTLQMLCKDRGIRANSKTTALIEALSEWSRKELPSDSEDPEKTIEVKIHETTLRQLSSIPESSGKASVSKTGRPQQKNALEELLGLCKQESICSWANSFGAPDGELFSDIFKVGEGTFAEVFCGNFLGDDGILHSAAFKIMPFDGKQAVNGEPQKTSCELIPEIAATLELSRLAASNADHESMAHNFIPTFRISVCSGAFPSSLLTEWDKWSQENVSENERPGKLADDQLYLVFAFGHGGRDLEGFSFKSLKEAKGVLLQVIMSLAVAENALAFEHRDLHMGNVLVRPTDETNLMYRIGGRGATLKTYGVKASIIDFTLSRLEVRGKVYYLDLETDPDLFKGEGDLQFECYRKQRKKVKKNWFKYDPKTNVYWIHFLVSKLLNEKEYTSASEHDLRSQMAAFMTRVQRYRSAQGTLNDPFFVDDVTWKTAE